MRILITRNNSNAGAVDAAVLIGAYLSSQDIDYVSVDSYDIDGLDASDFDLAIVLGGDGTILRTAHLIEETGVPLFGLNYGNLGFLANNHDEGVVSTIASVLAGDAVAEERSNLRIDVLCVGDDEREFEQQCMQDCDFSNGRCFFALNEMALSRGLTGRIIDFTLSVAGEHIADLRGDGLVVATATGSTAYALSAGGPLISPSFGGLVAVPVAPHTLHARAIVTAPNDVVEVKVGTTPASTEAVLLADGSPCVFETPIKRIVVRRGASPTMLVRYKHEGFYAHASEVFF